MAIRLYHSYKKELSVYPPEARFFSNRELEEFVKSEGKRDIFQDDNGNCTMYGVRVDRNEEPISTDNDRTQRSLEYLCSGSKE